VSKKTSDETLLWISIGIIVLFGAVSAYGFFSSNKTAA